MKTLLRFLVFEEGKMRIENLPVAILVALVVMIVMVILSCLYSSIFGIGILMAGSSWWMILLVRILVGAAIFGMFDGMLFILGMFILAMKVPLKKETLRERNAANKDS